MRILTTWHLTNTNYDRCSLRPQVLQTSLYAAHQSSRLHLQVTSFEIPPFPKPDPQASTQPIRNPQDILCPYPPVPAKLLLILLRLLAPNLTPSINPPENTLLRLPLPLPFRLPITLPFPLPAILALPIKLTLALPSPPPPRLPAPLSTRDVPLSTVAKLPLLSLKFRPLRSRGGATGGTGSSGLCDFEGEACDVSGGEGRVNTGDLRA